VTGAPKVGGPVAPRLPRGSLDPELILATAERLAAGAGLGEVTIRRVAAALGVQHTAVHHHFPRRGDLVDALLARAVRRFNDAFPVIGSEHWETHLRSYWNAYRDVLRADPALLELIVGQWVAMGRSQDALDLSYLRIDAQLGVLLRAGFSPEQAGYAYHLLSTYTRGCLLSERQFLNAGGATGPDDGRTEALVPMPGRVDRYPSLGRVAARTWSYTFATDADFRNGIDVIIAGLRAGLPESA
jgi:TetR/AcrR family transcriptional regulator, tetracycline repressor protein